MMLALLTVIITIHLGNSHFLPPTRENFLFPIQLLDYPTLLVGVLIMLMLTLVPTRFQEVVFQRQIQPLVYGIKRVLQMVMDMLNRPGSDFQ